MPPARSRLSGSSTEALAEAREAIRLEVQELQTPLERAELTTRLLREAAAVQRHVAALRMAAVGDLRRHGWSYRSIGEALGLSANAIAQIEKQRLGHSRRPRDVEPGGAGA